MRTERTRDEVTDMTEEDKRTAEQETVQAEEGQEAEAFTEAGEQPESGGQPAEDAAAEEAAEETEGSGEETGENGQEAEPEKEENAEQSAKPDKKDKQIEELTDKYKRLFAEFDNYRKRTDAEKVGMFNEGQRAVLLKILPLIDNFERALEAVPEDEKDSAFAEGISKIYKSFMSQLTEMGVQPIEAKGQPFDANLHNAVMHVEDEDTDENIVVDEFQKGYLFKDKVLRYSMVKVAN